MLPVDRALLGLEGASARRVRPVLAWLRERGDTTATQMSLLGQYLSHELPNVSGGDDREQHEVAWALGDLFASAGLSEQAASCRSVTTHETLAVWHWLHSFPDVPEAFWRPALAELAASGGTADVPSRAALSLASARALLAVVGDGLVLTAAGELPPETVLALDDRFRWTEEFPWMQAGREPGIAPLTFLHEHLVAQRLLEHDGPRLVRSRLGDECLRETPRLWRAVVDPAPRWSREFDRDALGVMAASVLRSSDFALGRVGEELARVLTSKWRPAKQGSVFDGASPVAQAWYQLGVPLGWWDTGRGPADRRPNTFGRAAAVAVFRSVAASGAVAVRPVVHRRS